MWTLLPSVSNVKGWPSLVLLECHAWSAGVGETHWVYHALAGVTAGAAPAEVLLTAEASDAVDTAALELRAVTDPRAAARTQRADGIMVKEREGGDQGTETQQQTSRTLRTPRIWLRARGARGRLFRAAVNTIGIGETLDPSGRALL